MRSAVSRITGLATTKLFLGILRPVDSYEVRDRILAWQSPMSLFVRLLVWVALFDFSFTLLLLPFVDGDILKAASEAGSAMFTLGYAAPTNVGNTVLVYAAAYHRTDRHRLAGRLSADPLCRLQQARSRGHPAGVESRLALVGAGDPCRAPGTGGCPEQHQGAWRTVPNMGTLGCRRRGVPQHLPHPGVVPLPGAAIELAHFPAQCDGCGCIAAFPESGDGTEHPCPAVASDGFHLHEPGGAGHSHPRRSRTPTPIPRSMMTFEDFQAAVELCGTSNSRLK